MRFIIRVLANAIGFYLWLMMPAIALPANTAYHVYLNAGQTYAIRALCAPIGDMNIVIMDPLFTRLSTSPNNCVYGRIGTTFTPPADGAPVQHYIVYISSDMYLADVKLAVEPDCADGLETTCTIGPLPIQVPGAPSSGIAIKGKFTYPGDQDWIRVLGDNLNVTPKPNQAGCFVSAKVITTDGPSYVVFIGGPSGCGYTAVIAERMGTF